MVLGLVSGRQVLEGRDGLGSVIHQFEQLRFQVGAPGYLLSKLYNNNTATPPRYKAQVLANQCASVDVPK
ncbi:hypothetical protein TWF481_000263 [Arthrobotrys musiformis]|uniref:Uncharacterized protein n=1 Tax=Arthrobotrys musiformis TaxID=47236 RepID=A0AAV9WM37_9PEZI